MIMNVRLINLTPHGHLDFKEFTKMTTKTLIKEGKLIEEGYNYRTADGRLIERVEKGRTTKWRVSGDDFLYRDLFTAYHEDKYFGRR